MTDWCWAIATGSFNWYFFVFVEINSRVHAGEKLNGILYENYNKISIVEIFANINEMLKKKHRPPYQLPKIIKNTNLHL